MSPYIMVEIQKVIATDSGSEPPGPFFCGATAERLSFDPHGERREITWETTKCPARRANPEPPRRQATASENNILSPDIRFFPN